MSETQPTMAWIDALAGTVSATGHNCEYLTAASAQWAQLQWSGEGSGHADRTIDLAERLRVLTGQDERAIATCLAAASREDLLQWALVLCRRHHQSVRDPSAPGDSSHSGSRCLAAVGSDHGGGILGRMASGRADARSPQWPLVPGFAHVPLASLAERINDSVAMVLLSPIDVHNMMQAISHEQLVAIGDACNRHRACLVIDHSQIPPHGGGRFWAHDAIAPVAVDAVIMSAGLTGGTEGGLLTLSEPLAEHVPTLSSRDSDPPTCSWVSTLAAATLDQWIEHSWCDVELDELATELAGRLARRECVRDLHVSGRTIGIELDIPAAHWVRCAADQQLGVATAGEFAVAMQPPLILRSDDIASLCARVDQVFDWIELEEHEATTSAPKPEIVAAEVSAAEVSAAEVSAAEVSAAEDSGPADSPAETADDSEYDVGGNDSLDDALDEDLAEESRRDDDYHAPAMPADPEIQS